MVRALDYSHEIFAQFVDFLQVAYTESEYKSHSKCLDAKGIVQFKSRCSFFKIHRKHFRISEFVETSKLESLNTRNLFSAAHRTSKWYSVNDRLCILFWNLSLHHIHIPERCYSDMISKLTFQNRDTKSSSLSSKQITLENISDCISHLKLEKLNQKKDVYRTQILLRSLSNIFPSDLPERAESICSNLMQNLVLPHAVLLSRMPCLLQNFLRV